MNIGAAAQEFAEQLTTEYGLSTTTAGDELTIPGGWLTADRLSPSRLDGTNTVVWKLYLIAGDHALPAVLDELGALYELVVDLTDEDAEFVTIALPNYSSTGLPALLVTITTEITEG